MSEHTLGIIPYVKAKSFTLFSSHWTIFNWIGRVTLVDHMRLILFAFSKWTLATRFQETSPFPWQV